MSTSEPTPSLLRGLGLSAATAIIVGGMIGQSIFLVTGQVTRDLGSETKVLAVWLLGGAVVLLATFCYGELGAALPQAGGDYIYLGRGLGPTWGFLFGWTSAWIQGPGVAATIASGLLRLVAFLVPTVRAPLFSHDVALPFHAHPFHIALTFAQLGAAAAIVLVAGVNYFGVRTAGRFQIVVTTLKVSAILLILALGFFLKNGQYFASDFAPNIPAGTRAWFTTVSAFLTALVPVMLAYNGFQALSHLGGEVRDPGRIIPRAAIFGVLVVVSLYFLINVVYFHALDVSIVANSQNVASDAAVRLVGPQGARWLTLIMIVSAFGSLHVNFMARARIPYAMARQGQFFSFVRYVDPRFRSPSGALLFHGGLAILMVLTGTFEEIYSLEIFSIYIFLALTAIALMRLRSIEPTLSRPYRAWGYPATPIIVTTVSFATSANLWLLRPVRSTIGVAVILLGVPFFRYLRKRQPNPDPQVAALEL